MKVKLFIIVLLITSFSNLLAQTDPFPNVKTPEEATIFLKLISENFKAGDENLLPVLIKKGADVNVINKANVTPLVSMIFANSTKGVKILLDASAKTDITFPGSYDTPITLAIRHGVEHKNIQILDLFIKAAADVNFKNAMGDTPLIASIIWKSPEMMRMLIEAGADPNSSNLKMRSPLHAAIIREDIELTEYLLDVGVKIDARTMNGDTPLLTAIKFDPVYLAKNINRLIDLGANVNLTDNEKKSPLYLAAELNNPALIQRLIGAGAAIDAQTDDGSTALYIAASKNYLAIVKILLEANANRGIGKNSMNSIRTPLIEAKAKNNTAIASLLETRRIASCSGNLEKNEWFIYWTDDTYRISQAVDTSDCYIKPGFALSSYKNGQIRLNTSLVKTKYQKIKMFVDGIMIFDGYAKEFNDKNLVEKMYKGKTLKIEYWTSNSSAKTVYEKDLKLNCSGSFTLNEFRLVNQIGQQNMLKAAYAKLKNNCR
jgi:ankyrin repeat protein